VAGLVGINGIAADTYKVSAFRVQAGTGSTPNSYRFGAAWGYLTDEPPFSGLLQLGAQFYWPELGRLIQQDPERDGENWYAHAGNDPLTRIDPEGLAYMI
jgi:RHS repeat-associated protein